MASFPDPSPCEQITRNCIYCNHLSGSGKVNWFVRSTKIDSIQKPVQLFLRDLHDIHLILWPGKSLLFQSLVPETKTVPIPVKDLHPIRSTVAERKEDILIWIFSKLILYDPCQTIYGFSHIRWPGFQENLIPVLRGWYHGARPKSRFNLSRR